MKRQAEKLYMKIKMKSTDESKIDRIIISVLNYYLYPEFRKFNIPFRKYFKWTGISTATYLFGAILLNNFVLMNDVKNRDAELHTSKKHISVLYKDAKSLVFDECLDSVSNTKEYIRFLIFAKSGIVVPKNVPEEHLTAIKENSEKMGIPLSIYVKVIQHESRFDSSAVNPTSGAFGYMQMMPRTFNHIYDILSLNGGRTATNNLMCGCKLLKQSHDYWYKRKNNTKQAWEMALACYAMGDSLPRAMGRVPEAVRDYVNYIIKDETF